MVTICFFTLGVLHHHVDLSIEPESDNAVGCSSKYIFVVQCNPPLVSVYNWAVTHLCDVDHCTLGFSQDDYLLAIGCNTEDSFMLAAGDDECDYYISSLHTYKVT